MNFPIGKYILKPKPLNLTEILIGAFSNQITFLFLTKGVLSPFVVTSYCHLCNLPAN